MLSLKWCMKKPSAEEADDSVVLTWDSNISSSDSQPARSLCGDTVSAATV